MKLTRLFLDETKKILELILEGYENMYLVVDEDGVSILDVVKERNLTEMIHILEWVPRFEVQLFFKYFTLLGLITFKVSVNFNF